MISYKQLQLGLIVILVMLFSVYVTLDILAYPLSDFATGTMAAIWSIFLILIDPQAIAKMIRKENGIEDTTPAPPAAT